MVIFGAAIVGFVIVVQTELYEAVNAFVIKHDAWHLDDVIMISAVMSIALVVFGFRRFKDLSKEIGARGTAEREAHRLAHHDALTGLPNRRFLGQTLQATLSDLRQDECAALLMLDLDGFKAVNDAHGHAAGDHALLAVSKMLSARLTNAILARIGGDEFAIVVPRMESRDAAASLARRIVAGFSEPFALGRASGSVSLGVSIGIVVSPDDGEGVEREDQRICLQDNGCIEGQGYLFSKAVPAPRMLYARTLPRPVARRGAWRGYGAIRASGPSLRLIHRRLRHAFLGFWIANEVR